MLRDDDRVQLFLKGPTPVILSDYPSVGFIVSGESSNYNFEFRQNDSSFFNIRSHPNDHYSEISLGGTRASFMMHDLSGQQSHPMMSFDINGVTIPGTLKIPGVSELNDVTIYGGLYANKYYNLIDSFQDTSLILPPSANALNTAFNLLSNMIVTRVGHTDNNISHDHNVNDTYSLELPLLFTQNIITSNLTAISYCNLIQSFHVSDAFRPVSGFALNTMYLQLSNLIFNSSNYSYSSNDDNSIQYMTIASEESYGIVKLFENTIDTIETVSIPSKTSVSVNTLQSLHDKFQYNYDILGNSFNVLDGQYTTLHDRVFGIEEHIPLIDEQYSNLFVEFESINNTVGQCAYITHNAMSLVDTLSNFVVSNINLTRTFDANDFVTVMSMCNISGGTRIGLGNTSIEQFNDTICLRNDTTSINVGKHIDIESSSVSSNVFFPNPSNVTGSQWSDEGIDFIVSASSEYNENTSPSAAFDSDEINGWVSQPSRYSIVDGHYKGDEYTLIDTGAAIHGEWIQIEFNIPQSLDGIVLSTRIYNNIPDDIVITTKIMNHWKVISSINALSNMTDISKHISFQNEPIKSMRLIVTRIAFASDLGVLSSPVSIDRLSLSIKSNWQLLSLSSLNISKQGHIIIDKYNSNNSEYPKALIHLKNNESINDLCINDFKLKSDDNATIYSTFSNHVFMIHDEEVLKFSKNEFHVDTDHVIIDACNVHMEHQLDVNTIMCEKGSFAHVDVGGLSITPISNVQPVSGLKYSIFYNSNVVSGFSSNGINASNSTGGIWSDDSDFVFFRRPHEITWTGYIDNIDTTPQPPNITSLSPIIFQDHIILSNEFITEPPVSIPMVIILKKPNFVTQVDLHDIFIDDIVEFLCIDKSLQFEIMNHNLSSPMIPTLVGNQSNILQITGWYTNKEYDINIRAFSPVTNLDSTVSLQIVDIPPEIPVIIYPFGSVYTDNFQMSFDMTNYFKDNLAIGELEFEISEHPHATFVNNILTVQPNYTGLDNGYNIIVTAKNSIFNHSSNQGIFTFYEPNPITIREFVHPNNIYLHDNITPYVIEFEMSIFNDLTDNGIILDIEIRDVDNNVMNINEYASCIADSEEEAVTCIENMTWSRYDAIANSIILQSPTNVESNPIQHSVEDEFTMYTGTESVSITDKVPSTTRKYIALLGDYRNTGYQVSVIGTSPMYPNISVRNAFRVFESVPPAPIKQSDDTLQINVNDVFTIDLRSYVEDSTFRGISFWIETSETSLIENDYMLKIIGKQSGSNYDIQIYAVSFYKVHTHILTVNVQETLPPLSFSHSIDNPFIVPSTSTEYLVDLRVLFDPYETVYDIHGMAFYDTMYIKDHYIVISGIRDFDGLYESQIIATRDNSSVIGTVYVYNVKEPIPIHAILRLTHHVDVLGDAAVVTYDLRTNISCSEYAKPLRFVANIIPENAALNEHILTIRPVTYETHIIISCFDVFGQSTHFELLINHQHLT